MKTILVGINAKFIHTNLAVRYLTAELKNNGLNAEFKEFTISQHFEDIIQDLYLTSCDAIAFSCYIWNIDLINKIIINLKKVRPELFIIMGGPEVSFESIEVMNENDGVDLIITGEGEGVLPSLIRCLGENEDYSDLPGILFKARGEIYKTETNNEVITTQLSLSDPYNLGEVLHPEKIYYYETSRGCPHNCSFCLSGRNSKLRYAPLERVKDDLLFFIQNRVKQVKFVDRTFNSDKERACEIFRYLIENDNGYTNFHFEIGGELLDGQTMSILETAPPGLFQFEIGIQSTNDETLEAIHRKGDQYKLFENIHYLMRLKSIHIHVDLIAGLPYEDFFQFRSSFNDVFALKTDMLQLGFLKLIKGSELRLCQHDYDYVYTKQAPYEVLSSHKISFGELIRLKQVEKMLNLYWNSGKMKHTIDYVVSYLESSAFKFFDDLAQSWYRIQGQENNHKYETMLKHLQNFLLDRYPDHEKVIYYLMHFDYYKQSKQYKPWCKEADTNYPVIIPKVDMHELLQNRAFIESCLPEYIDLPVKQMLSKVQFILTPPELVSVFAPIVTEVIEFWQAGEVPDQLSDEVKRNAVILFHYSENKARNNNEHTCKLIILSDKLKKQTAI
ncbi:MAG: DUF4080 domain-containing protein [Tindallia sp. MSAO_Bac2]|nr:MAG: DUF4080 domain-containing protein [Tindallia sp. MSAO_Bac2]